MNLIDDLIEQYAPEHTEFDITIAGKKFKFAVIESHTEYNDLRKGAEQFVKMITDYLDPKCENKKPVHPSWLPYLTDDKETLVYVWMLSKKCLEADTGELDFLKVQAKLPLLFEQFKDQFLAGQVKAQTENEIDKIKTLKNDLSETS